MLFSQFEGKICDEGKMKKILTPVGIYKLHGAYWILLILNLLGLTNFIILMWACQRCALRGQHTLSLP